MGIWGGILLVLISTLTMAQESLKELQKKYETEEVRIDLKLKDKVIEEMLQEADSVDGFVELLKKNAATRKYLKQCFYVASSHSLQESAPPCPRIIMHNEDTSLVFSVNGCQQHDGFQDVEVYHCKNQSAKSCDLSSVYFPQQNLKAKKVSTNSQKCTGCHADAGNPRFVGMEEKKTKELEAQEVEMRCYLAQYNSQKLSPECQSLIAKGSDLKVQIKRYQGFECQDDLKNRQKYNKLLAD